MDPRLTCKFFSMRALTQTSIQINPNPYRIHLSICTSNTNERLILPHFLIREPTSNEFEAHTESLFNHFEFPSKRFNLNESYWISHQYEWIMINQKLIRMNPIPLRNKLSFLLNLMPNPNGSEIHPKQVSNFLILSSSCTLSKWIRNQSEPTFQYFSIRASTWT